MDLTICQPVEGRSRDPAHSCSLFVRARAEERSTSPSRFTSKPLARAQARDAPGFKKASTSLILEEEETRFWWTAGFSTHSHPPVGV